jgi:hypothetical protein
VAVHGQSLRAAVIRKLGPPPHVNRPGYNLSVKQEGRSLKQGGEVTRPLGEGSLPDEIRRDLRRSLRGRQGWMIGMGFNTALAAAYFSYQRSTASLPERGLIYVGAAVTAWVLADTVTTNQLGSDGERVAAALGGGISIGRIILVKNASRAVVLLVIAFFISVVATSLTGRWPQLPDALLVALHVVLTWMALGNIVSVLLPYRPIEWRKRWRARTTWPRWLLAQLIPYCLFFVVGWLSVPVQLIAHGRRNVHPGVYAVVSLVFGIGYWAVGTVTAKALATLRHERLVQRLGRAN